MMLVAGLAVAGLIGIAAAFYFSIRSGKRPRSAGAGGAGAGRRPGSGSPGTAKPGRTGHVSRTGNTRLVAKAGRPANGSRAANAPSRNHHDGGGTGPDPVLDSGDPVLIGDRRGGPARPAATATDPGPGPATADPRSGADKPRRRVGLRKGSRVDEELWPTEAFGGVSDEQFWDDLAADKPLAATARTARQEHGTRNRLLDAVPPADNQAAPAPAEDRARDDRARDDRGRDDRARGDDRGRDDRARGEGRRSASSGAYPGTRTGPNPAAERTAIQPAYAATQPVQSMPSQVPGVPQAIKTAAGASRPLGAPTQPAETRGRRRPSSDEEDPLTSAAFSLRPSGPVDGRSSLRSRDMTREQFAAVIAKETQSRLNASRSGGSGPAPADSYDGGSGTSAHLYPGTTSAGPASATRVMNTPPDGVNYGHRSAGPAGDAQRQNSARSHARHSGTGQGTGAARQVHPQGGHQGTGRHQVTGYQVTVGYQVTGSYQAAGRHQAPGRHQATGSYQVGAYQAGGYPGAGFPAGGFQGNGYRGNGHRASYDPREDNRRLTHRR